MRKIALVIFMAIFAFSIHGYCGKGKMAGKKVLLIIEELDLKDDQINKLMELQRKLQNENIPLFKELDSKMQELKDMALGGSLNTEKAKALINEIADIRARLVKNRLKYWLEFTKILSDSQKRILRERLKKLRSRRILRLVRPGLIIP